MTGYRQPSQAQEFTGEAQIATLTAAAASQLMATRIEKKGGELASITVVVPLGQGSYLRARVPDDALRALSQKLASLPAAEKGPFAAAWMSKLEESVYGEYLRVHAVDPKKLLFNYPVPLPASAPQAPFLAPQKPSLIPSPVGKARDTLPVVSLTQAQSDSVEVARRSALLKERLPEFRVAPGAKVAEYEYVGITGPGGRKMHVVLPTEGRMELSGDGKYFVKTAKGKVERISVVGLDSARARSMMPGATNGMSFPFAYEDATPVLFDFSLSQLGASTIDRTLTNAINVGKRVVKVLEGVDLRISDFASEVLDAKRIMVSRMENEDAKNRKAGKPAELKLYYDSH